MVKIFEVPDGIVLILLTIHYKNLFCSLLMHSPSSGNQINFHIFYIEILDILIIDYDIPIVQSLTFANWMNEY